MCTKQSAPCRQGFRHSRRMTRAGLHVDFRVGLEMGNRNTCMKELARSHESLVNVVIELASVMFEVRLRDSFEARRVMCYPIIDQLKG